MYLRRYLILFSIIIIRPNYILTIISGTFMCIHISVDTPKKSSLYRVGTYLYKLDTNYEYRQQ